MAGVITAEDAGAAQDVHFAVDALNRALEQAHYRGLRIVLERDAQGEPERTPTYGGKDFFIRGDPPRVTVEVSLPLPATEAPDAETPKPPEPRPLPSCGPA